ncbi:MAG: hypothetical protein RIC87_08165 [Kiloniellales bacterium]
MSDSKTILPAAAGGTELTRFNAVKHGLLSRYTVLPWEDGVAYAALHNALLAEHAPLGPTEEHLVEELAGILWRKRRLRMAEAAAFRRGLAGTFSSYEETARSALAHRRSAGDGERVVDAVQATPDDTAQEFSELEEDEAMTRRALAILDDGEAEAYSAALDALQQDTRDWWENELEGAGDGEDEDVAVRPDPPGLRHFLEQSVLPWYEDRRRELAERPLIREQAHGQALNPDRLEKLSRYETHLDRKLERTLGMLFKLKELRGPESGG